MEEYGIEYDHRFTPKEGNLRKLALSIQEAKDMESQTVKCPICGFPLLGMYGEKKGIARIKCQKCKYEGPVNLAYFKTYRKKHLRYEPELFRRK